MRPVRPLWHLVCVLTFLLGVAVVHAQTASRRAERLGRGMNLSVLEYGKLGSKDQKFFDDAVKRKDSFAAIAKAGFKTVRIPVNFGSWASLEKPYNWEVSAGPKVLEDYVKWALANDLMAIVDLHHVESGGKGAAETERLVWLWSEIATRFKNTDPERVLFELRNEPHDVKAEEWRAQAEALIKTVRAMAPDHTLVVGFHDWNSRQAMLDSKPFADKNIIYTFHYYDPFIFTHQGATWSSPGLPELRGLPFPANKKKIEVPKTAKGTWIEERIRNYEDDSKASKMFDDLKAAKDWAVKHDVPIFLGEFGSFGRFPTMEDRCRHADAVYSALGKLEIPNAWWEWDGGFAMFDKGTTKISNCMQSAVNKFGVR